MMDAMASAHTTAEHVAHEPLRRRPDRGLLGGVGAGVAQYLGVEVLLVRCAMAMVVVVGGLGVAIYGLAWALIPVAPESEHTSRPRGAWREAVLIVVAVGGMLVFLRHDGLWIGDWLVWPLVLGACGMALVWRPIVVTASRSVEGRRPGIRGLLLSPGRIDLPRLVIGGLLVAFASASLLHTVGVLRNLGDAIGAVAVVTTALGLLFGPWFVRLARTLATERAARIREQERAEVAAHLHDSVLQTLALIQKRAGDPREVAALARSQERELRRWLFERPGGAAGDSLKDALERVAAEVEELHGIPIEVVVVGEEPLDERLLALVLAAREAMTNAAKFAGSDHVDLYAELGTGRAEVFVRDRGAGFDPANIPEDRRGVRDSIVGRVERHGGQVSIRSAPGEGTEVELVMEPVRA
jgi:signal transduction histidine kinase/phage shock protein PspC (stress-responsive transcriptional regulator)